MHAGDVIRRAGVGARTGGRDEVRSGMRTCENDRMSDSPKSTGAPESRGNVVDDAAAMPAGASPARGSVPRCPTIAVSAATRRGWARRVAREGKAYARICRSMLRPREVVDTFPDYSQSGKNRLNLKYGFKSRCAKRH